MASQTNAVARQRTLSGFDIDEEENVSGDDPIDLEKKSSVRVPVRENSLPFWQRFRGVGRRKVGVVESLKAIARHSWLNVFFFFIPFAWAAHFHKEWPHFYAFIFSFLGIMSLESTFDYVGEQLALYCGKDFGDLIMITLNNVVEATLGIILLFKCQLKLLQSTIVGVVVLHLLLIPGTAFITGGARIWEQKLHPHTTQTNHTLLSIGILTLMLPASFFAALDRGAHANVLDPNLINDTTRDIFLRISRGSAVILLVAYICSRIFLHSPPGDVRELHLHPDAPEELKQHAERLANTEPEVNQWVCLATLGMTIAIMAPTAEWLVDSIDNVREQGNIQQEWFGLILLPIVSFSGDGAVAIMYFIRYSVCYFRGRPPPITTLAKGRAIDLSVQFILFWMPLLVLLGWWASKPMTLLFDLFEVAILLGACFLVNYVTADSKTNWLEGYLLVAFYLMIMLCAWFYTGQDEIDALLVCSGVREALTASPGGE